MKIEPTPHSVCRTAPIKPQQISKTKPDSSAKAPREKLTLSSRSSKAAGRKTGKSSISAPEPKKWTVLVYGAANERLVNGLETGKLRLTKTGAPAETNLLMDLVTPEEYLLDKDPYGSISKLYEFGAPGEEPRLLAEEKGLKVNSPEHLEKSLTRVMKKYPAQNYLIIAGGHGMGFLGLFLDKFDETYMPVNDFKNALEKAEAESGVNKEQVVLGMDSCLMGQAEAACQLKDAAGYLVASPSPTGEDGWNFGNILQHPEFVSASPRQMAANIVEANRQQIKRQSTIAAYDLSLMPAVKEGMDELGKAVLHHPEEKENVFRALDKSCFYLNGFKLKQYYRDLGDFCRRIEKSPEIEAPELKKAARRLSKILKKTVFQEAHAEPKYEGSTGISVYPAYCPPQQLHHYPDHVQYRETAVGQETCWEKAMTLILDRPIMITPRPPRKKENHENRPA